MTFTRRRFMTISAGFALAPVGVAAQTWQGRAFGADISMIVYGPRDAVAAAIEASRTVIAEIEAQFSLYNPESALSELNFKGILHTPDPQFLTVMNASDFAYKVTDGLFDPSVQRLWQIVAENKKPTEYYDTIGWDRVQFGVSKIKLDHMQALTFNGIAQGYATDRVTDVMTAHGMRDVLVNIGEYRGVGGPWKLSLQDPEFGDLGMRTLNSGAIATSSPKATSWGRDGHIIHRDARIKWSTVSVEAGSATLADSMSTAMVLAPRDQIEEIKKKTDITRITLVDFDGNLVTL